MISLGLVLLGLIVGFLLSLWLYSRLGVRLRSDSLEPQRIGQEVALGGAFQALLQVLSSLCICVFKGNGGRLTVDPSCRGALSLWVIPEDGTTPAFTPATAGTTYAADGFKIGNTIFKVDGSTCVTITCAGGTMVVEACVNLIALALGKKAPYAVPAGTFANEPLPGAAAAPTV